MVPSVSLFLPDEKNSEVKEDWVSQDFQTEINFKTSEFGITVKIRFDFLFSFSTVVLTPSITQTLDDHIINTIRTRDVLWKCEHCR